MATATAIPTTIQAPAPARTAPPSGAGTITAVGVETDTGRQAAGDVSQIGTVAPNPFGDEFKGFVTLRPDSWSSDRTPPEGMESRGDHIDGILRNLGIPQDDIPRVRQMVVDQNDNIRNPDVIRDDREYKFPTNLSAEEIAERYGQPESDGSRLVSVTQTQDGGRVTSDELRASEISDTDTEQVVHTTEDQHSAEVTTETDRLEDGSITGRAIADGDQSDAAAVADVGSAENALISETAVATGEDSPAAAAVQGGSLDEATVAVTAAASDGQASAKVALGDTTNTITQADAVSRDGGEAISATQIGDAHRTQVTGNAVAGDGDASAVAVVDTATDTVISERADAVGEGVTAAAESGITETDGTVGVNNVANAQGEGVEAITTTEIETNTGDLHVHDAATATGSVATGRQEVVIENNQGQAKVQAAGSIAATTAEDGTVIEAGRHLEQDITLGGDGEAVVMATADASGSEESVVDQRIASPGEGGGVVSAQAIGGSHIEQDVSGFGQATLTTVDAKDATRRSDAKNAVYEGHSPDGRDLIHHEGTEGTVQLGVSAGEGVTFIDGVQDGNALHRQETGNEITGEVHSEEARIFADTADSLDITTHGTEGDDRHSIAGPEQTSVVSNLDAGEDRFTIQTEGETQFEVNKAEGELTLGGTTGGETTAVIDAGDATIDGTLTTSEQDDTVYVRSNGADHDATFNAQEGQDVFILDLADDAPVPKVLTEDYTLQFWRSDEGVIPDGWQDGDGKINAENFERVVIRRNGEVVHQHGFEGGLEEAGGAYSVTPEEVEARYAG